MNFITLGLAMNCILSLVFLFTFISIPVATPDSHQVQKHGINISSRNITQEEIDQLKAKVGIYQAGKNYNVIVDGHGTGLVPPTEKQWEFLKENIEVIDSVFTTKKSALPDSVDWTKSKHFPPIGNQGIQGSCIAWPTAYYMKTFQEACENDWDLSGAIWDPQLNAPSIDYQDKIASPAFTFNQLNNRVESVPWLALWNINSMGVCSWKSMPYHEEDDLSWPSEEAYREAPIWRTDELLQLDPQSEKTIIILKNLLAERNLITVSMNGLYIQEMMTLDDYPDTKPSHSCTIVGYNDHKSYVEEGILKQGAFKVANSWGPEWSGDGCFWISYALLSKLYYLYVSFDKIDYKPNLIAVFQASHEAANQCNFAFEYKTHSKSCFKYFLFEWLPIVSVSLQKPPLPNNRMVLDITEFEFNHNDTVEYFACIVTDLFGTEGGTITHFSVEFHEDYDNMPAVYEIVSEETPCPTRKNERDGYGNTCYIWPIQVREPNGGEILSASDVFTIEWQSLNIEDVLIHYSSNLTDWRYQATVRGSESRYYWTVPNISSGVTKIKVSDRSDSAVYDESNAYFTIIGDASIQLISPDGGEEITMGHPMTIEWERSNYDGGIDIHLYYNGFHVDTLAMDILGDTFNWTPMYLSSGDRFQIQLNGSNGYPIDMSDSCFSILSPVNIVQPNGGETWLNESEQPIIWSTTENIKPVNLYLYKENTLVEEIAIATTDTFFLWMLPLELSFGSDYKIGVMTSDRVFEDRSDQAFTITEAKVKWKYDTGKAIFAPLAIDDYDQIYACAVDKIFAFSLSGDLLWQIDHTCGIDSPPIIDGNSMIYISSKSGGDNLIAMYPDGSEKWRIDGSWVGGFTLSHFVPSLSRNNMLYAVNFNHIYTINGEGEKTLFYSMDENFNAGDPTIGHDHLVYCSIHNALYSIDSNGEKNWRVGAHYPTELRSKSIIIDLENNLYCLNYDGVLYKLNGIGEIIWNFDLEVPIAFSRTCLGLVIGYDRILYATAGKYLYALTMDGELVWKTELYGKLNSPPVVGKSKTIYVLSQADIYVPVQKILALNFDGSIRWEYTVCDATRTKGVADGPESISYPIIDDHGHIYIGSRDGYLYSIETCTETGLADTPWPIWRHDMKNTGRQDDYLSFIYPDNEEQFNPGDDIVIRWENSDNIDTFQLEYSTDRGKRWELIDSSVDGGSSYLWEPPNFFEDHQHCLIKISMPGRDAFNDCGKTGFWINNIASKNILHLYENYPNPFNNVTCFKYYLYEESDIRFEIYNMLGEKVKSWGKKRLPIGIHKTEWNGRDDDGKRVSSGVYFLSLSSKNKTITKKMVLLR